MALSDALWGNWLIIAFLAPFFWSLGNILDTYFINDIYEDEWDGLTFTALFQLLPWIFVPLGLITFQFPGKEVMLLAFLSGGLLAVSYLFYFKALRAKNDGVAIQVLWNLSVPLVPLFSWWIAHERLAWPQYLGIGLTFIGASLFSLSREGQRYSFKKIYPVMLGAVICLSLSMILQGRAYHLLENDFWTGLLIFSIGTGATGIILALLFSPRSVRHRVKHALHMGRQHLAVFAFAESLNIFGVLFSQRAISLSPSVSFVVAIESLSPIFIMLISVFLIPLFSFFDKNSTAQIYRDQLIAFKTKIAACCIMAIGIFMIS